MSTHEVLVVKVKEVKPHPNADLLEIISLEEYGDNYSIISKKGQFSPGDLGIFIEPDYVVSTDKKEFSFLSDSKKKVRISAKKLRGVWSEGLLIEADKTKHKQGDNVIEEFEIERYEPELKKSFSEGSELKSGWLVPEPIFAFKYDLENAKKYFSEVEGKEVYFTTKIHGANARFVYTNGEFFCGSRTSWKMKPGSIKDFTNKDGDVIKKEVPSNSWWEAFDQNPWLGEFCKNNPDMVVYGEIYGEKVQGNKFHYGHKETFGVRIFDILNGKTFVSFDELINSEKYSVLQKVPVLYKGICDKKVIEELAEKNEDSLPECGDNHIREGIVIRPVQETYSDRLRGMIKLKWVSKNYLNKS